MKIAILTSGILPVPAVQGGAVENLIDFYLEYKVDDPVAYLYYSEDPDGILKNIALASIRSVVSNYAVDDAITTGKNQIQTAFDFSYNCSCCKRRGQGQKEGWNLPVCCTENSNTHYHFCQYL